MSAPKQGQFSTGLCDCCAAPGGCGRCCYGFWCSCCLVGDNFKRLPGHVTCGSSWGGAFATNLVSWLCLGGGCFPQMMGRTYLRTKYGIPGSEFGDFCITWCCSECAACQEAREMDIREGAGKPVVETGYPAQPGAYGQPQTYYPGQQQMVAPPPQYSQQQPGMYPQQAYPQQQGYPPK